MYSQDLSNCTTVIQLFKTMSMFLYSQDLSNCTTNGKEDWSSRAFLYSQDLSNCTTQQDKIISLSRFCTLKI